MNALLEARRLLCQLGLSGRRFNGDLFLERFESRLGIAVAVIPDPRLPAGGISGARITTNGSHVVFYPAGVSDRLQLAVIYHECAHLLLSHRGRSVDDVLTGTDPPSPDDELAAEALGAALGHFAEQPDRLRSLVQGADPASRDDPSTTLRARLRAYYQVNNALG